MSVIDFEKAKSELAFVQRNYEAVMKKGVMDAKSKEIFQNRFNEAHNLIANYVMQRNMDIQMLPEK